MKGMVFQGKCKVALLDFPDPLHGPGEAVIEMKASGMCDTDLHDYRHGTVDPVEQILKLAGDKGVICAVDRAGHEQVRSQAVRNTSVWGRIALIAVGGNLALDVMKDLIAWQRTLVGSFASSEIGMKECAPFYRRSWRRGRSRIHRRMEAVPGSRGLFELQQAGGWQGRLHVLKRFQPPIKPALTIDRRNS